MRQLLFTLVLLVLADSALAQANGTVVLPSGTTYTLRFRAQPDTLQVCIHEVTIVSGVATAVNRVAPAEITPEDAIACTTTLVADNSTTNTIAVNIAGGVTSNRAVAARAYAGTAADSPVPSALSNWQILRGVVGAPILLN